MLQREIHHTTAGKPRGRVIEGKIAFLGPTALVRATAEADLMFIPLAGTLFTAREV
jgi:hypothetical protein